MSVKLSNLKTLVSPLSGCFQSSCFLTSIINSTYTAGITTWLASGSTLLPQVGGLAQLEAAYLAGSSANATTALDALVTAISGAIKNSSGSAPIVAARSVPLASSEDGTQYTSTAFNSTDLSSVNAGGDLVYVEKLFVALNSGTQYLERIHVSDTLVINIFVALTANPAVTCTTDCGSNPIPSPSIGLCGDDDSSSEDCGNRYGYNFPFFQPCASTASWTPL